MLVLPALAGLEQVAAGAAVYADDTDPRLFHVVPAAPRIRPGPDGRPMIVLVKFRTDPGDPAAAGGTLDVQTELVLDDTTRAALSAELSRRAGGPVRLADPTYIDGAVELVALAPGSGPADTGRVVLTTRPSLAPGLIASTGTALSRDGAAFLWSALRETPCPVVARYRMTMLARLPAGSIRIRRTPDGADVEVLDWPVGDPALDAELSALRTWAETLLAGTEHSELLLTAGFTVPWPVVPQAALAGLAEQPASFVEADLTDPWFATLDVAVGLNARLDPTRIAAVTVRLRYGSQRQDVVFPAGGPPDQLGRLRAVVDPALGRTYAYVVEVQFAASTRVLTLPERTSDRPYLLISLDDLGWLTREVSADGVDWDSVVATRVTLRYGDPAYGVPDLDEVVVLDRATPSSTYRRAIDGPATGALRYRVTHTLHDGSRIDVLPHRSPSSRTPGAAGGGVTISSPDRGGSEPDTVDDPWWAQSRGRLLLVPDVWARRLPVRCSAPGGFAAGPNPPIGHVVALEHHGRDGRTRRRTLILGPATPAATWLLGLADGDPTTVRCQVTTSYADGTAQTVGPYDADGERSIAVGPVPAGRLTVTVLADLVDPALAPVTTVTLQLEAAGTGPDLLADAAAGAVTTGAAVGGDAPVDRPADPSAGTNEAGRLAFAADRPTTQIWEVYLAAGVTPRYRWSAEYRLADGSRRLTSGGPTGDPVLVLPPPPPA